MKFIESNYIEIDLGKGVIVKAPIKKRMTREEFNRMVHYIYSVVKIK